ncbi:MAG: hypothetical protein KF900_13240 [Bacteroidetes bacterium]|nr:hypothetical protein [Bacteroidota bacterium]
MAFEARTSLLEDLEKRGFTIHNNEILVTGKGVIAKYYEKHTFYKLLNELKIDWRKLISKQLLPDGALLVGKTIYIIEKKYQMGSGSVDEKLQTCDFKRKQYQKLLDTVNIKVEYFYLLNQWFDNSKNKDVFEYIRSVGCDYFFEYIPLVKLGLPVPE